MPLNIMNREAFWTHNHALCVWQFDANFICCRLQQFHASFYSRWVTVVEFVILSDVLNFPRTIHKDLKRMLIALSLTL